MITPTFEEMIRLEASKHIKKAIVTINGQQHEYPVTKTVIRDGFFKHYIEVEDEPIGIIERAVAVDENGQELIVQEPNFDKGDEGWQMAFKVLIVAKDEQEEGNNEVNPGIIK